MTCGCGCGETTPVARQAVKRSGLKRGDHYRFCPGHYARTKERRPLADRFWEKVEKGDGCWLWQGCIMPKGYGQINAGGRDGASYAHRVAYELTYGPIPEGMFVCHSCDVRACVNPDHLWLGTVVDNNRDAMAKQRSRQDPETGRFVSLEIA